MKFGPSPLGLQILGNLKGIELGGSAHNPFHLNTINVDWTNRLDTSWKEEEIKQCGETVKVDVVADGGNLPFKDGEWDFVVSSHCLEHNWNTIGAIKEWLRVVRDGGFVFTIFPHPERTFDRGRSRTSLRDLIDRNAGRIKEPSLEGVIATPETYQLFHHTIWHLSDAVECVHFIGGCEIVATQDPDDKVGNGFTFVMQKLPR
jgi:SAM-dependent methyltransferase